MAEFERGDIVVYENPQCPEYAGVGIVVKVGRYYGHHGADCLFWAEDYMYLEKVGEVHCD